MRRSLILAMAMAALVAAFAIYSQSNIWTTRPDGTTGFFEVEDTTNSRTPFTIETSSPTNSLYIKSSGNVGVGTNAPDAPLNVVRSTTGFSTNGLLHLKSTAAETTLARIENTNANAIALELDNSASSGWQFRLGATGIFTINDNAVSGGAMIFAPGGGGASGLITIPGSLAVKGNVTLSGGGVVEILETTNPGSTSTYGKLWPESDDELHYMDGGGTEHVLTPAYAGISATDNATATTISSSGVAVQVTIFNTNNPSRKLSPDHTTDDITIDQSGDYQVLVSSTVNSVAGSSPSRAEMTVRKNNGVTLVPPCHADRSLAGGSGESGSIGMSCIAALSASDTIEVWIENETNNSSYVVEDISLSVIRLDY